MDLEPALRRTVEWIAQAVRDYAVDQGWNRRDYRVFVRVNRDWGRVHIILAAHKFPGDTRYDQWAAVMDYLDRKFKDDDPQLTKSVSLTLLPLEEIEQGGPYAVSPQFVEIDELLGASSFGPPSGTSSPL
ncbi:MAG TPA: hypothetical protein VF590_01170, partial [Isosphaeraceae bacterium]